MPGSNTSSAFPTTPTNTSTTVIPTNPFGMTEPTPTTTPTTNTPTTTPGNLVDNLLGATNTPVSSFPGASTRVGAIGSNAYDTNDKITPTNASETWMMLGTLVAIIALLYNKK